MDVGVVKLFSPCNAALNTIFSFAIISLRKKLVANFKVLDIIRSTFSVFYRQIS